MADPTLHASAVGTMCVAVVDDAPSDRAAVVACISRYASDRGLAVEIREYDSGDDLLHDGNPPYDVVFLDVDMDGLDGFETARAIRAFDAEVSLVFVTHVAQCAIRGYEVGALSYLLKPVSPFAVDRELDRVLARRRLDRAEALLLPLPDGMARVPVRDIVYAESAPKHRVSVHAIGGVYVYSGSLKGLDARLDGRGFAFCNSCYLVNMRYVKEVRQDSCLVGGRLDAGERLYMSRRKRRQFMRSLADYASGSAPWSSPRVASR